MKKIKRCNWLTALGFIALLTVLLASCGNVFEETSPSPVEGSGRVSIDFGGANARTVFPVLVFDEYKYFFTPAGGDETKKTPDGDGRFTLTAGEWTVRVDAYIEVDAQMFLAATGSTTFTMTADDSRVVRVGLVGMVASGSGTFSWYIEFPQGAEVESLSLRRLPALTQDAALPAGETTETSYSGTAEIDAGFWLLNLRLSLGEEFAGISEVVHIYDLLTSEFGSADAPIVFTEAHFTSQLQVLDQSRWIAILEDIAAGTYEGFDAETGTLDLRPYLRGTATAGAGLRFNGVFDPWVTDHANAKAIIRQLLLPDDATGIAGSFMQSPFREFTNLTHVSGTGITSIDTDVFMGARSLTSVSFPVVTSIGESAFHGATSLTEVYFPMVTSIGSRAFWGTRITRVSNEEFPSLRNVSGFDGMPHLREAYFPDATSIGESAFHGAISLTEVYFPRVTSIGNGAFSNTVITRVTLGVISFTSSGGGLNVGPGGLRIDRLTYVNLPHATSIGANAFNGATRLTEVYLPLVTSIGNGAFWGTDITRVTLGVISFTSSWQTNQFSGPGNLSLGRLTYVNLPHATSIGANAFNGATRLTEVYFPRVISIGSGAFSDASITRVSNEEFPSLTSIGANAFNGASRLTEVYLPLVTSIGRWAFGGTGITRVSNEEFPSLTSIGADAFNGASNLTEVYFPRVTFIGRGAFANTGITRVSNEEFPSLRNVSGFDGMTHLREAYFPDATSIGNNAFSGATSLETVFFPLVTSIGGAAFFGTALVHTDFSRVTTIADAVNETGGTTGIVRGAFERTRLTEVCLPLVTSIGSLAFSEATRLAEVHIPQVVSLGNQVFMNTGSTPLTITMRAMPPIPLGTNIFQGAGAAAVPKIVTVRVLNPETYTTDLPNWVDGFRGRGLDADGNFFPQANLNTNVRVNVVELED